MDHAERIIQCHTNEVVKYQKPGLKFFLISRQDEQQLDDVRRTKHKFLDELKEVLGQERVDRRCGRSVAEWLKDKNLARVTKFVGNHTSSFGYQNKDGKFLLPDEALFLLETNRLEIFHEQVPVSILKGYSMILQPHRYFIFRKLALLGAKFTSKKLPETTNKCTKERKRKYDNELQSISKIIRLQQKSASLDFEDVFKNLRQNSPRSYDNSELPTQFTSHTITLNSNDTQTSTKKLEFELFMLKQDEKFVSTVNWGTGIYGFSPMNSSEVSYYKMTTGPIGNW